MKNFIRLICLFILSIIIGGCGNQINKPIQNIDKANSGYCKYDGQDNVCNSLMVVLKSEFQNDIELKEQVKKMFSEYNITITNEYTAFVGWSIKFESESKMFEFKNKLEQVNGVSVGFNDIVHTN